MLASYLGNRTKLAPLFLRITLGGTFIIHGWTKLYSRGLGPTGEFFAETIGMHPGLLWATVAGLAEFFGGICVLLGLFPRWGAFFLACVMAVALLWFHLPRGDSIFGWQLALLAMSLSVMFTGGGALSLGQILGKGRLREA